MTEKEKKAQYLFHNAAGMTAKKMRRILKYAGSFEKAEEIPAEDLLKTGALRTEKDAAALRAVKDKKEAVLERYERLSEEGVRYIADREDIYPERLKNIPDRPVGIFVKGELPKEELPSAAIIGARACSEYGKDTAVMFGEKLAQMGVQIISGLAAGIDGSAQRGAVKADGRTFGILGCGVNICYPKENYYLYRRILDKGGGIISEYPQDTPPLSINFPARNRIISGLGDCLLVFEARVRSGTSITVDFALEQGKEVFALPGRITDALGKGCNELIKNGAAILTAPQDVLDHLSLSGKYSLGKYDDFMKNDNVPLVKNEKTVYACLDSEAKHIDDIARASGLNAGDVLAALIGLELKGFAKEITKFYYMKDIL